MNIGKLSGLALLALLLAGTTVWAADDLARDFTAPPQEAKPWVYWWFEGGWGNPPAMARDIAEMAGHIPPTCWGQCGWYRPR